MYCPWTKLNAPFDRLQPKSNGALTKQKKILDNCDKLYIQLFFHAFTTHFTELLFLITILKSRTKLVRHFGHVFFISIGIPKKFVVLSKMLDQATTPLIGSIILLTKVSQYCKKKGECVSSFWRQLSGAT